MVACKKKIKGSESNPRTAEEGLSFFEGAFSESTFSTLTDQFAHCVISHNSASVYTNRTTISLTNFNFVAHLLGREVSPLSTATPDAALNRF